MANQLTSPFFQYSDSKGNALTAATIHYCYPGTFTPKPVWLDRAETQPAPNPIVLDSTGRSQVFGQGLYRQIIRNSVGTTIWDGESTCTDETFSPLAINIAAQDFPSTVASFRTSGFNVVGRGAARYVRLTAGPAQTEITAGLGRWLFRSNGNTWWWRLAEEQPTDLMFGVRADAVVSYANSTMTVTGTDDTAALQAAIDFTLYFNPAGHSLRLPLGQRRTTDTLHFGYGMTYVDWHIEADMLRGVGGTVDFLSAIYPTFIDRPAINIQGARRVTLKNVAVIGPNHGWLASNQLAIADRADRAGWRGPQASPGNGIYAPACGIAIDGYSGVRQEVSSYPDAAYPSWLGTVGQYGKAASSQVRFDGVSVSGFEAGIVVQPNLMPAASNGDFVRWLDCNLSYNVVALAVCNSDARAMTVDRSLLHFCHTALDNVSYGSASGNISMTFNECSFDHDYQIFNVNLGITTQRFAPTVVVRNPYAEGLYWLGDLRVNFSPVSVPGAVRFVGGEISFFIRAGELTPASYLDGKGDVSVGFDGTSIGSTYGVFPIDVEVSEFRVSFPTIAYNAFDITTTGGQRAMTALAMLYAPNQSGPLAVRPFYIFGYDRTTVRSLLVESQGWKVHSDPLLPQGCPVPLFVRTVSLGGYEHSIGKTPEQALDRATYPLANLQATGIEWGFDCPAAFLNDPARPDYCLGVGDIVRDEVTRHLFYIKSVSFAGSGAQAVVSLVIRQITGVKTTDNVNWTGSGDLSATVGMLRFFNARRVIPARDKLPLLMTTAASQTANLTCPGSESGAAGQLGTTANPVVKVGDFLLASDADSHSPMQSVFPGGKVTSVDLITGAVSFDTAARRSAVGPAPLFVRGI